MTKDSDAVRVQTHRAKDESKYVNGIIQLFKLVLYINILVLGKEFGYSIDWDHLIHVLILFATQTSTLSTYS